MNTMYTERFCIFCNCWSRIDRMSTLLLSSEVVDLTQRVDKCLKCVSVVHDEIPLDIMICREVYL